MRGSGTTGEIYAGSSSPKALRLYVSKFTNPDGQPIIYCLRWIVATA